MEESGYRFGVGVLVMASAIIGVLLIAFFGAVPTLWVDRNQVSVNFKSAPRVAVDTDVRKNGVRIGRVAGITLLPRNEGVVIRMELDRKVELTKGEVPRIVTGSIITGDAVIEFAEPTSESLLSRFDGSTGTPRDGVLDASEAAAINEIIVNGSYLVGGEVAQDPLDSLTRLESTFVPVMSTLQRALTQIEAISTSVQQVVGQENGPVRDVVSSIKETSEAVKQTVNTVDRIGKQFENAQIPSAVSEGLLLLPELIKEAQTTLAQTQRTLKGFEQFSASLDGLGREFEGIGETIRKAVENASVAIENIAEITEPVSKNSEVLVANAIKALSDLDAVAVELKTLTSRVNNSNGTVAQLIDNPQLYMTANNTLLNIESVSRDIKIAVQKVQPIINDVRVFTDKVARDPGGQIGVRSALKPRPLGTGLK